MSGLTKYASFVFYKDGNAYELQYNLYGTDKNQLYGSPSKLYRHDAIKIDCPVDLSINYIYYDEYREMGILKLLEQ